MASSETGIISEPVGLGCPPRPQDSAPPARRRTFYDRLEAFISRLSVRNNFWHKVCSYIWLPYAFWSGIKVRKNQGEPFSAVLPFRRLNKNWYKAMAGAALLANAEIAGGMYVFEHCGGDYAVVCKNLSFRFLRPCTGPALYRIATKEDIAAKIAAGGEFDISLEMNVIQYLFGPHQRDRRVGVCDVTFHVTPKAHLKARAARRHTIATSRAG